MLEPITLSPSMQDYLETILELSSTDSSVRITDIANSLNIAKPSVNQTIKKLKGMGFVNQMAYGPVELTEHGKEMAQKILHRHTKLKLFLTNVLGVNSRIAEEDACLMEHAVSSQTIEKLTDFLEKNGYLENS